MNEMTWQRIEALFTELAAAPEAERTRRLSVISKEKPKVHRRLLELFAADARTAGLLDLPLGIAAGDLLATAPANPAPRLPPGTRIGAYEIERELGEGGMGIIYLAHRADGAYEQQVALKVLRDNLIGTAFAARFRSERNILARLQHPGIARLLDAGTTSEGIPYFVMEYVAGNAVTTWIREHAPPLGERLTLFLEVLHAVQFAHRNLVIHCDLKPGNILVDDDRKARLLDFGIARLLAGPVDGGAPADEGHALTPQYAAPELLRGEAPTIASDIYSLGAVLYEMLSGCKPHGGNGGPQTDIDRLFAPPVRLDRLPTLDRAQRRRLRGDLAAIVDKAMMKDPLLRYPTVEAMAEDLRRHLAHLPIAARPGDNGYRLAKFVRRHRIGAVLTGFIALAVVGGLAGTAWQSHWRGIEARKAEEVKTFALKLFSGVDPERALGKEITARQLVEEGAARIGREFSDQPATRAEIITFLADLFDKLGEQSRALAMIDDAVSSLETAGGRPLADALQIRGRIRISRGKFDDGASDINGALALHRRYGTDLAAAEDYDQLAIAAQQQGDAAEAQRLTEAGLQLRLASLGQDNDETANSYNNLGVIARNAGDLEAAERYHRTALDIRRKVLPEIHPGIALSLNNLGALMLSLGRYLEAERYFSEALDQDLALYGERHPLTVTARNNIGATELRLGRYTRAENQLKQVLTYWHTAADNHHPNALLTRYNLAAVTAGRGDFTAAEREWRLLLDTWREQFGDAHYLTAAAEFSLGSMALEQGRLTEAEPLLAASLAHRRAALGEAHPYIADSLRTMGQLALARGELATAGAWIEQALAMQETILPAAHPSIALTRLVHGRWLIDMGRAEQGSAALEHNLRLLENAMGGEIPELMRGRYDLARARLRLQQPAAAATDLAQVRDTFAARFGSDAWQTAVVECDLAEALGALNQVRQAQSFAHHAGRVLARYEASEVAEIADAQHRIAALVTTGS